jgi:hypothetical protein
MLSHRQGYLAFHQSPVLLKYNQEVFGSFLATLLGRVADELFSQLAIDATKERGTSLLAMSGQYGAPYIWGWGKPAVTTDIL